jgi:hypothetical protein
VHTATALPLEACRQIWQADRSPSLWTTLWPANSAWDNTSAATSENLAKNRDMAGIVPPICLFEEGEEI